MKKLILLVIISLAFTSAAFAAGTASGTSGTTGGLTLKATAPAALDIGKASKGVLYGWQTSTTGYAVDTYHLQGTKFYGTAYDSTALYFKDVGVSQTLVAPSSSVSAAAFSGWTAM